VAESVCVCREGVGNWKGAKEPVRRREDRRESWKEQEANAGARKRGEAAKAGREWKGGGAGEKREVEKKQRRWAAAEQKHEGA
jgi:hypothetical protein